MVCEEGGAAFFKNKQKATSVILGIIIGDILDLG